MTEEEIKCLHPAIRIAGYLTRNAALSEYGAKLRTVKQDEEWTEEENTEWDRLCDQVEPWWYAMSDDERNWLRREGVENILGKLCRGEEILEKKEEKKKKYGEEPFWEWSLREAANDKERWENL